MNYPDPAGQFKSLVKHFFGRFFDFDAVSSAQIDSIEKNSLTFQVLALMVMPGLLVCLFLFQKYSYYTYRPVIERDLATLTDKCFLISLSMILLGFVAVFEWDTLFPDRKDYLIFTPMPVSTRTIFYAKSAALAAFLLAFTIAIDLGPTLLFPGAVLTNNGVAHRLLGKTVPVSQCIRYLVSNAATLLLGNVFIFLSVISLQGIVLSLFPSKVAAGISRWVRFLCLLSFFGALLYFPQVKSVDQLISSARPIIAYYPPIWFTGIYEVLLGSHAAVMWSLAGRALLGLAIACLLSVLTYSISYRRFMRKSLESGAGAPQISAGIRRAGNLILDRFLLRKSENRAAYHFVGQTIFRSPRHVLYIGAYLAIGLSIAGMGLATVIFSDDVSVTRHLDRAILSVPLILSFFLLVGMRVIFAIPVDLNSNWLFRLAPIQKIGNTHAGVRKLLVGMIVIPIYVVAGIFYQFFWSWSVALPHVCFGITMSTLLMEALFCRFPKIPFTCSYLPGAARIVILYPFYFLGFSLFGYSAAQLGVWLVQAPERFCYFYVIAAILFVLLIRRNTRSAGSGIRFEEESELAPIYLDLRT